MSSHFVWTLLRMISINHTPCHYGDLVSMATRVKPLLSRLSCHGRKHSQTIFTIEILIKILAASTCMIDFFCKNMAASKFCDERKSTLIYPLNESRWAADVYILKESKWAKGQGGLLLFTPRQSQNGKGSRWAAVVYPLKEPN